MSAPLAGLENISVRFGSLAALQDVNLVVRAGEVSALLGENGAGKSTLMHVLAGLLRPDAGRILWQGRPRRWDGPRDALAHGVGMVHQHLHLVPSLTVAENVLLGLPAPRFLLAGDAGHARLRELGAATGLGVEPGARVEGLSLGECQRVEILKVLYRGARLLVLDEPTAVLSPLEVPPFFSALRALAQQGTAVVLITHNLGEVLDLADRVTVLRHGRVVAGDLLRGSLRGADLERMILGPEAAPGSSPAARVSVRPAGAARLALRNVVSAPGGMVLKDVNLEVGPGEILGVAGVAGNGQGELAEVVVGLRGVHGGQVLLDGEDVTALPAPERLRRGVGYVPEDRSREGLAPSLSVVDNLFLRSHRQPGRSWRVRWDQERRRAEHLVNQHDIRVRALDQPAGQLSGGNQQKLILAREMDLRPRLLVAAQPTRGLDVGAAGEVRRRLKALADQGCAVLVVSGDLEELCGLAHRVAVMLKGRVVGDVPQAQASVEKLGPMMLGLAP